MSVHLHEYISEYASVHTYTENYNNVKIQLTNKFIKNNSLKTQYCCIIHYRIQKLCWLFGDWWSHCGRKESVIPSLLNNCRILKIIFGGWLWGIWILGLSANCLNKRKSLLTTNSLTLFFHGCQTYHWLPPQTVFIPTQCLIMDILFTLQLLRGVFWWHLYFLPLYLITLESFPVD